VGAALAVGAGVVLAVRADNGIRSTRQLSSPKAVALAELDDAFYQCLSDEAHQLVPDPSTPVEIAYNDDPGAWITLAKAIDRWANLVRDPAQAEVVLSLRDGPGPVACAGRVVVGAPGGLAGTGRPGRTGQLPSSSPHAVPVRSASPP